MLRLRLAPCLMWLVLLTTPAGADTPNLPDDLVQNSLVLDMDSGELGLFRIEPRYPGPFQTFTRLDVALLEKAAIDPRQWVLDRVSGETARIVEAALVLVDPDGPLVGTWVNGVELQPESVHAEVGRIASSPIDYCENPAESPTAAGFRIELECIFWIGGVSSYLQVRLEQAGVHWYVIVAQAQNRRRFQELLTIANSLRL